MNENKRMTSIAKRISRSWLRRTLVTLLWVNITVATLAVGGWCFAAESTGGGLQKEAYRAIKWNDTLPLFERPRTIVYEFENAAGEVVAVSGAEYFALVQPVFGILLAAECLTVLSQNRTAKKRAQRLLEPLYRMTATAQELSQMRFDPEKLHHLEDAIASVSPLAPDVRLTTGDRDLHGLEEAINALLTRMHESYREQSRFVSDASHELRTPIAVIQGYADMLDRWGKDDPKVLGEGITAIKGESAHMKTLVEQLLFLARGDSGKTQLVLEDIDLADMMREVHEESQMIHEDYAWRLQAQNGVLVRGDIALLKQAARILVDNAVKYTAPGNLITLRANRMQGVPCFEVQDSGIGIAAEDLPHIFDRFFRSDPARTRQTGGTGLGLSIAKWIVERHGGHFDVLSRDGIGTRISVLLPLSERAAEQPVKK